MKGDYALFDEYFEEFLHKYSTKETIDDAEKMSEIMAKPLLQQEKSYQFFDVPIPSLAQVVPKFRTGQYVCISGAPAMGKSTMACIIAERIPKMLMISYEMDSEEIHDTIVSRNAGIDSRLIEFNTLNFEQKAKVDTQRRILKDKLTMFITDTPPKGNDLGAYIRRMKQKHDINGVVIDYAQLIPLSGGNKNKVEQYEELSRKFKQIARELKIIVIALSSINGASLKENRSPNLSDLRGSLSFGADADTVIFTYGVPSETYGTEEPACSVAKQRKGKTGKVEGFKYIKAIHSMF
jgi:replicative DNA helicase